MSTIAEKILAAHCEQDKVEPGDIINAEVDIIMSHEMLGMRVIDIFNDPEASKVLATKDAEGKLNVVPIGTMVAIDEETIGFADVMLGKTRKNLETTGKV